MPRNRIIQQSFFRSSKISRLSHDARYTLIGLLTLSDDYGNVELHPAIVKGAIWPYDDVTTEHVSEWIDEVIREELLIPYEADGNRYAAIVGWNDRESLTFQSVNRPSKTRNPTALTEHSRKTHGTLTEPSRIEQEQEPQQEQKQEPKPRTIKRTVKRTVKRKGTGPTEHTRSLRERVGRLQ